MRVLVIGRSGQLARALARTASSANLDLACAGRDTIDLMAPPSIATEFNKRAPDVVINAAAYTDVDKAETETDAAFALNRDAPAALARACRQRNIPFVHVSTDYVFDGLKSAPYVESDTVSPLNVYGKSKAEGERLVLDGWPRSTVIRTSAVFDSDGPNFVTKLLAGARAGRELSMVEDAFARPTWAQDLAHACFTAAIALHQDRPEARGIFHFVGADDVSWANYAEAILALQNIAAPVQRVSWATLAQRAARPRDSRLDPTKIEKAIGVTARPWREALSLCFASH